MQKIIAHEAIQFHSIAVPPLPLFKVHQMPNSDKVISRGKKNRRAISSPEVKAANAAAKFVAKASAKATADSTPEAIAKAEAKRVAKVILVAKAAVVAEA
jgi:NACalpha-BTF3-like transcription factor